MVGEVLQPGLDAPVVLAGHEDEPVGAADLPRQLLEGRHDRSGEALDAGEDRVQIHLVQGASFIGNGAAWNHLLPADQRFGFDAAVRFDHGDDHSSSPANRAQNASGSRSASACCSQA